MPNHANLQGSELPTRAVDSSCFRDFSPNTSPLFELTPRPERPPKLFRIFDVPQNASTADKSLSDVRRVSPSTKTMVPKYLGLSLCHRVINGVQTSVLPVHRSLLPSTSYST